MEEESSLVAKETQRNKRKVTGSSVLAQANTQTERKIFGVQKCLWTIDSIMSLSTFVMTRKHSNVPNQVFFHQKEDNSIISS